MGKGRDRRKKAKAKNERSRGQDAQQASVNQGLPLRAWEDAVVRPEDTKFYEERKAS